MLTYIPTVFFSKYGQIKMYEKYNFYFRCKITVKTQEAWTGLVWANLVSFWLVVRYIACSSSLGSFLFEN